MLLQPNNATVPESNPHIFRIPRDWLVGQVYVAQSRPNILIICKRVIIYTRCTHTKCAAVVIHVYNLPKLTVKIIHTDNWIVYQKNHVSITCEKINYFVMHEMIRTLKFSRECSFHAFLGFLQM